MSAKRDIQNFAGVILEERTESVMLLSKDLTIIYSSKSPINPVKMTLKDVIGRPCHKITHRPGTYVHHLTTTGVP